MEIVARFYHAFSKSRDVTKFAQLKKVIPATLLDALQDTSRGIKFVLQNTR